VISAWGRIIENVKIEGLGMWQTLIPGWKCQRMSELILHHSKIYLDVI